MNFKSDVNNITHLTLHLFIEFIIYNTIKL